MTESLIRCFLALSLTPEARLHLQGCLAALQPQPWSKKVRWIASCNWHLTLVFLGDQPASWLDGLRFHLQQHDFLPVADVGLNKVLKSRWISGFPDANSRIVALEFHPDEALMLLKSSVDTVLLNYGFIPEKRHFRPHVTLGRVKNDQSVCFEPVVCDINIPLTQITLYQSTLLPQGSEYKALWSIPV